MRDIFLADRFGASHFLEPVLSGSTDAFFTNGDDPALQSAWARENGLKADTPIADILLAQIEAHRTEVFYNLDPVRYGDVFLARLPGCVKRTVAWRAAPSGDAAFLRYDVIVNNFPGLLNHYRAAGARAEYFAPAHDPEMDPYGAATDRPIDVLFVGGYSRHHKARAQVLETVAALGTRYRIALHLDRSRMTALAESPFGLVGPLSKHRRPQAVRDASLEPVYGRDLYAAIAHAKVVINGAVDMAGKDRGNMRCWETMGCGALLLTDLGRYPAGMVDTETMRVYDTPASLPLRIAELLANTDERVSTAQAGHGMIKRDYSKAAQWKAFVGIAAG